MIGLKPHGVRGLSLAASAALMIALLMLSGPTRVSGAAITEWTIPPAGATPYGIAATGGLPTIWFVEHTVSRLGRLDPTTGEIKEYQLPPGRPWDIKLDTDPAGNFRSAWISFYQKFDPEGPAPEGYYIGKYDGTDLHLFKIPITGDVKPRGLWLERDPTTPQLDVKYVWIAMEGGYIGRLDPVNPQAGATWSFSYWKLPSDPTNPAKPVSIIFVPMYGGVFYTDEGRDRIGFLNPQPSATLVEWRTIASGSDPYGIAVDKDGRIWFTEAGSIDGRSRIGMLNPYTNVLTEYRIPTDNAEPRGILVDNMDEMGRPRPGFTGKVWIALHRANKIAKFDPEGNTFVEFTRAMSGAPHGLAMDLTGSPKIWFTDEGGARIGRIDPSVAVVATTTNFISTATTSVTTQTSTALATTSTTITTTNATTTLASSTVGAFITSTWTSTTASTRYEVTETSQVLVGTTYVTITETSTSTRSTTVPATATETSTVAPTTSTALVSATTTTTVSTTTMTIPMTATSTSLYLTTTYTTLTTTSTQTITTTATYLTAAAGMPGAAIPGFPIESIAIGLLAGLSALALIGRGRRRRA
ncbi:MAG: hypothetical protein QXN33_04670 [Candidatus Bathyarchaeia archaeon]